MTEQSAGSWEDAVRWLIAQPGQQEMVEACYYDAPLAAAAERYWRSEEWAAVRTFMPATPGRALDLGAGNGIGSYALARDGWQVDAVEPDPSALVGASAIRSLAAEHQLPITVVQEWGESLPFPDASFDLVFARQVFHHARSLPELSMQVSRVLRPGGRLLVLRDHVVSGHHYKPAFFDKHPLHNRYGGEDAYSIGEYEAALRAAGLRIDKTLRSFDSPINLAPRTRQDLAARAASRLGPRGVPAWLARAPFNPAVFALLAPLASRLDNRPGRLVSFICTKP